MAFKAFVEFGTCYEVEKSIILTIMVRKLVISVTSDLFGLHSALNFIPRLTSLRSVPLGIKLRPHFGQKALRKQISQFPDHDS